MGWDNIWSTSLLENLSRIMPERLQAVLDTRGLLCILILVSWHLARCWALYYRLFICISHFESSSNEKCSLYGPVKYTRVRNSGSQKHGSKPVINWGPVGREWDTVAWLGCSYKHLLSILPCLTRVSQGTPRTTLQQIFKNFFSLSWFSPESGVTRLTCWNRYHGITWRWASELKSNLPSSP